MYYVKFYYYNYHIMFKHDVLQFIMEGVPHYNTEGKLFVSQYFIFLGLVSTKCLRIVLMGYIRSLMRVLKQNFTSFRSMIGLHILQDIFVDITGHEIDWYDKEDGWTEERRKKIWNHNILSWDQYKYLVIRHLSQSQLLAIFPHCL